MKRAPTFLATVLAALASVAHAQHGGGYADFQGREIKALSPQQIDDLQQGRGMGMSLPAELNGMPGPLHVLQLREKLTVTPEQASRIEKLREAMASTAQRLGYAIVQAEAELDAAFKRGTANEASIRSMTARIGELNAELRAAHLTAHLKTRRILTDTQVAAYNAARGYDTVLPGVAPGPTHRH